MRSTRKLVSRRRSSRADKKTMRQIGFVAVSLSLALLMSCEEEERYILRFSHSLHVVEMEMECPDCHGQVTEGEIVQPDHDSCIACHEDVIEADEISRETCGTCHIEKDLEAIGEGAEPKKVTRGVFRHSSALQDRCRACHGDLLEEDVEQVRAWTRSDVVAVREAAHAMDLECVDCHEELSRDSIPEPHLKGWTRRHGIVAEEKDAICSACHHDTTCRECHQSQQPNSHNNLWRLRTHGIEASWARERCAVCHQDDFCAACHSGTQPRSHTARWRDRHCLVCHTGQVPGQGCGVCHEGEFRSIHDPIMPDEPVEHIPDWPDYLCFGPNCHAGGAPPAGKFRRR